MCMTSEPARTSRPTRSLQDSAVASGRFDLPANLTEWASPQRLRSWVEEEVQRLDWDRPEVAAYLRAHSEYRPQILLSLLAYAYATQVLSSDDIVARCYADRAYQLLCQGPAPSAGELGRFRRENRDLLRAVLSQVFLRAVRERCGGDAVLLPPGLKKGLLDSATERLNVARHMDSLEE
jgi:hypothetical protein